MIIKNIFSNIYISPFLYILILIFLITGNIKKLLIFMSLIMIHEIGHFITAKILGWKTDKIYLYPYGGISKFNQDINTSINEELLVLVMGPVLQIIFYLIYKKIINIKYLSILTSYNIFILKFNLLPIYPLDGGKIISLILNKLFAYKKAFKITIIMSFITEIMIVLLSIFNNEFLLTIIILMTFFKTKSEYMIFKLIFQKYILERIFKVYNFKKIKLIKNINEMKKDNYHLILNNNKYIEEKEFLRDNYYKKNNL